MLYSFFRRMFSRDSHASSAPNAPAPKSYNKYNASLLNFARLEPAFLQELLPLTDYLVLALYETSSCTKELAEVLEIMEQWPPSYLSHAHEIGKMISDYAYDRTYWHRHYQGYSNVNRSSHLLQRDAFQWLEQVPDLAHIFIFHHNGYFRMKALSSIQTAPSSAFFFAAIIMRLNDWVPQVRDEAVLCLQRIQVTNNPALIASTMGYIVEGLATWERIDGPGRQVAEALLHQKDIVEILSQKFLTNSAGKLARQLKLMMKSPCIDCHLAQFAFEGKCASVRRVAYKALLTGTADWIAGHDNVWTNKVYNKTKRVARYEKRKLTVSYDKEALFLNGLKDKAAIVRRCVADEFLKAREELTNINPCLDLLLEDKNKSVRERGEWLVRHLAKQGQPN